MFYVIYTNYESYISSSKHQTNPCVFLFDLYILQIFSIFPTNYWLRTLVLLFRKKLIVLMCGKTTWTKTNKQIGD